MPLWLCGTSQQTTVAIYPVVEDGIMLMDVPSFEFCKPRKLSKVIAPANQGPQCPGFTIQVINGSPKIPCPYGIIRMDTSNSYWNLKNWLNCRGCRHLHKTIRPKGKLAIYNDKVRRVLTRLLKFITNFRAYHMSFLFL